MIPTVTFVITCITAVISFVTLTVNLTRYITKAESKIDATETIPRSTITILHKRYNCIEKVKNHDCRCYIYIAD